MTLYVRVLKASFWFCFVFWVEGAVVIYRVDELSQEGADNLKEYCQLEAVSLDVCG